MWTSDAGRIRVRWYWSAPGAPDPGGSVFGSSDWDEQPGYLVGPGLPVPLGEEYASRAPFVDWRDGTPPPWNYVCDCAFCPDGAAGAFKFTVSGVGGLGFGFWNGTWEPAHVAPCIWSDPSVGGGYQWKLQVLAIGQARLTAKQPVGPDVAAYACTNFDPFNGGVFSFVGSTGGLGWPVSLNVKSAV